MNRCSYLNLLQLGIIYLILLFWNLWWFQHVMLPWVTSDESTCSSSALSASLLSPSLFPLLLGNTMKQTIKKTSLKRCGFHLHVCSVGARACRPIFAKKKGKKVFPVHLPLCLELIVPPLAAWEFLRIIKKKRKEKKHSIWYFSGNLIRDGRLQQCVVSGLYLEERSGEKGSAPESECVFVRVCKFEWEKLL